MHSRIFQVSKNPILEDDFITEDRYYDNFVGQIADYAIETDAKSEYPYLQKTLGKSAVFETPNSFRVVDKAKWFGAKCRSFRLLAKKFSDITIEEFSTSKYDMDMFTMDMMYDDKYSYYIDDNGEYFGIVTLDTFIRECANSPDETWYLGAVFDYHY